MGGQEYKIDPIIEKWHYDFDQMQQLWSEWCDQNATKYASASQAWAAFIRECQQQSLKHNSVFCRPNSESFI